MSTTKKEATQAQQQTQQQKKAAAVTQPVVYLGPTIEKVVAHGTVFNNGLPEALKERIEAQPFINGLIFPVSEYAVKAAAVSTRGSALFNLARQVDTE